MGFEVRHGRIPDLAEFSQCLADGRLDIECVQFVPNVLGLADAGDTAELHKRFGRESSWGSQGAFLCSLIDGWIAKAEDDHGWFVDLDRRFDQLEWTLAALEDTAVGLAELSVRGEQPLVVTQSGRPMNVVGGQGSTQRVSSPSQCERVAEFLTALTRDDTTRAFDWSAMIEASVYKAHHPEAAASQLEWTLKDFACLREFYASVANAGHAVLVTTD